jgi:hypothetical protein
VGGWVGLLNGYIFLPTTPNMIVFWATSHYGRASREAMGLSGQTLLGANKVKRATKDVISALKNGCG